MHLRLIAVGDRQPAWVDDGVATYTERYPRAWKFRIDALATTRRKKNDTGDKPKQDECMRILSMLSSTERVVLLDERGASWSSKQLAEKLADWQADARDVCFVIGGPDGVSDTFRERADSVWSLSKLTLPHGMARVLFSEQLYRAWTLQTGHPYHRE